MLAPTKSARVIGRLCPTCSRNPGLPGAADRYALCLFLRRRQRFVSTSRRFLRWHWGDEWGRREVRSAAEIAGASSLRRLLFERIPQTSSATRPRRRWPSTSSGIKIRQAEKVVGYYP